MLSQTFYFTSYFSFNNLRFIFLFNGAFELILLGSDSRIFKEIFFFGSPLSIQSLNKFMSPKITAKQIHNVIT